MRDGTDLRSLRERAERFRRLHEGRGLFVLPNAWDVPSARLFEDAGFPAVATSSAGMMVSLGYPDGERIPPSEYFGAVRRIAERLSVPLSADIVAGFGDVGHGLERTVRSVLEVGAVGVNLEDADPVRGGLIPLPVQLAKLRAVRKVAEGRGVPLVINARTDALAEAPGSPEARLREAIRRAVAFRGAGADCVYPMRLVDRREIATFVREVDAPVNVMVRPGLPSIPELERLGVRRLSFGPAASYAALGLLRRASEEILLRRSFRRLTRDALTFAELNRLATPRAPARLRRRAAAGRRGTGRPSPQRK
jgi:2-methylisocitrate lyase-like PEP mutase family enzyme